LNLFNRQIAQELDLGTSDVQAMTEHLRQGLTARTRTRGKSPGVQAWAERILTRSGR
jgi:hypothetical protein